MPKIDLGADHAGWEGKKEMLTIKEVSIILNSHRQTIRGWATLKAYRFGPGNHRRFKPEDVIIFIKPVGASFSDNHSLDLSSIERKGGMLKTPDVARILHVSDGTVRRWANNGTLKAYYIGPREDYRFDPNDIEVFVSSSVEKTF